jgi:very-short-patch-repair endonuclease
LNSAKRPRRRAAAVTLGGVLFKAGLDAPFRGSEARALGLVSRGELYGPRFVRLFPDVFAPVALEPDLAVRSLAAYLLVRDRGGVLAGYSAARLLGADCAPRNAPAEVLVPGYVRAHRGLRIGYAWVPEPDVTLAAGCRVTTAPRTGWDLARRLPLVEAVVAVDTLAHRTAFDPAGLLARRAGEPGARGCRRLASVVALSDPRAESPMETRLRVGLVRAGLVPEVQYPIVDEHGFTLARVDLAYPAARLAVEYDGALHFDRRRAELDRQRDSLLARYGWETLRLVTDDVGIGLFQTTQRVRDILALRGRPA